MAEYKFAGEQETTYVLPDKPVLVVKPGDVREFDTPPDPVFWVKVDPPKQSAKAALADKEVK